MQTGRHTNGKVRLAVIFGGRSGEHEVSLMSASSVIRAIDKNKYDVVPIGITKEGRWLAGGDPMLALSGGRLRLELPNQAGSPVVSGALLPEPGRNELVAVDGNVGALQGQLGAVDVVFPVLHGTYGEDGTMQGLLELADIPYVGAGVAGSAVGMDKALAKAVFTQANLPQLDYVTVMRWELEENPEAVTRRVEEALSYPCFIKPANMGSSVGISKVHNREELLPALQLAAAYDRKLVAEAAAGDIREVEVSVLGNDKPVASVPGEIIPAHEFYDYDSKYNDDRSELVIPARISPDCTQAVRSMAVQAFMACDCAGLARVDFFVDKQNESIWLNEINTLPGFTQISMYPKLWEATGLSYPALVDRLIELALERHADKARSKTSYD